MKFRPGMRRDTAAERMKHMTVQSPTDDSLNIFRAANYRGIEYLRNKDLSLYMKSCGIQQCLPGYSFGPIAREGYHLHVVLSGKGVLRIAGREFPIHENQLFVLKDGEEAYYCADREQPWYYVWVTFGGEQARHYMEYAGFEDSVYVLDAAVDTHQFFDVVREIIERPYISMSSEIYRLGLSMRFLSLAIESFEKQDGLSRIPSDLTADDYVEFAVQYINNNYPHIRISDVAKYIGINRTYFSGIFRKKMYMSPQEYLMQVRMNRGREMLMQMDEPVYVIAQSVGYEDQLSFSKIFKKKFGLSPENYRKKIREQHKNEYQI